MENGLVCTRLKDMLASDKRSSPIKLESIVKSEIVYLLKNYMEIEANNVDFSININDENKYIIVLNAKVDRLKQLNFIV